MASTYSSNLKIELITTGEKATTWGTITNTNLGTALEESIVGSADVSFSSANKTISLSNSNASQDARNLRLNLTGTTGGTARTLTVPDIEKAYIVNNGCSDAVSIKNSSGAAVSVPAGKTMWVYSTGSAVVDVVTALTSITVGNISLASNAITSTDTDGNIALTPNGAGDVQLDADTVRVGDSNANATITTNGTGDLILNTNAGTDSGSLTIADGADGNISIAPNGTGSVDISKLKIASGATAITSIVDEDDMTSDSATAISTQQSIKKYVDDTTAPNTYHLAASSSITGTPVVSDFNSKKFLYLYE